MNNENSPKSLPQPDSFFLHDIALLPKARGQDLAQMLIDKVVEEAIKSVFKEIALVAVEQSGSFWDKAGFRELTLDEEKQQGLEKV